ncbi:MAG: ABC transporter ATP-binding protein [Lachnospiraceae bacterium]|nr:ABC transporter ATP-binding protein [Lachnospiraceae bacterium]
MSDLGKLIREMGVWRKYLFLLALRAPYDAVRTWMLASLMRSVFRCLEADNTGSLLEICVVYGLLCMMLFIYNGVVWSNYAAFAARMEVRLQQKMFHKILGLPLRRVDSRFSGEWITRLNSDIQAAFTMMNGPLNIPHLTVAVINTMLSSFLMLKSNLLFLAITWVFILLQLFVNYKTVLEAVPKLKEESQNAMAENTSAIKPLITEADTILLYDAEEMMMKKCEENSRKLMKINMKIHVRSALSDVGMRLFGIGGYLVILLMGYGFIPGGTMAFSDVVYCFQVRGSVMAGVFMFVTCFNNLKTNSVCVKRVCDILEE